MVKWPSWILLTALVAVLTVAKVSLWSLDRPTDADELVYLTLAHRLAEHPLRYDLLGTHVMQYLDTTVYARPLFFHPPLFPAAVRLSGDTMLVPWLSNAVTLWLVWWLGLRWFDRRRAWMAVILYACCPIAFLCGCRLWIDGFLTAWMTAAVAAMVWCLDQESAIAFLVPGLAIGMASLAKMPGLLVMVPVAALWARAGRAIRPGQVVCLVTPVVLMLTPWLAEVWGVYHSLALSESRIPDADLGRYPFIALARQRPFWFYLGALFMVAPIHVFSFWGTIRARWDIALWPWTVILIMTLFGVSNTFQFRYIAPAMPGLCLLAADRLSKLPPRILWMLSPLLLYGLACGIYVGLACRWLGDLVPVFTPTIHGLF